MAGGLYSRLKTWIKGEDFKSADINAEFNNVITNFIPIKMDDYSATVSQMQSLLSPGGVGTEVQATNMAEEIRELRYQIKAITGGAQWYSAPANTISGLSTLITNGLVVPPCRIQSGKVDANNQPMFITAVNAGNGVTLNATSTNLVTYVNNSAVTFSADITQSGLSLGPSGKTCLVNDTSLTGTQITKTQGEYGTVITIDTVDAAITALNGTYQAFKLAHSGTEYFFARINTTNNCLDNASRGYFFNPSNAIIPRLAMSNNDVITLLKAGYVFALNYLGTPALDVTYNLPVVALTQPSSPSTGDYWLDLSTGLWKKYTGAAYVDVSAVPLGIVVLDDTNSVAARSYDFFKPYSNTNTMQVAYSSATVVMSETPSNRVSVYGNEYFYKNQNMAWTNSADCDSGVTVGATTTYWFYITDTGNKKISDIAPFERTTDLFGFYHPSKPWRCIGENTTNGGSQFLPTTFHNSSKYFQFYNGNGDVIANGGYIVAGSGYGVYPAGLSLAGIISPGANTINCVDPLSATSYPLVVSWAPSASGLMIIRGGTPTSGTTVRAGEGFTITSNPSTGLMVIAFSANFADVPIVVVTNNSASAHFAQVNSTAVGGCTISAFDAAGVAAADAMDFIAIGQRLT